MMTREERVTKYREGLNPKFIPYYDALFKALDEKWAPYCGLRTMEDQAKDYAQGRENGVISPGKIITNAKPGMSPHNWGCGVDITIIDSENAIHWLDKDDPVFEEIGEACKKVGLRWGGDFQSIKDPGHCELMIKGSWREIFMIYEQQGQAIAMHAIVERALS